MPARGGSQDEEWDEREQPSHVPCDRSGRSHDRNSDHTVRVRHRGVLAACAALVIAVALLVVFLPDVRFAGCGGDAPAPTAAAASDAAPQGRAPITAPAQPSLAAGSDCTPHAHRVCDAGDAWWYDSCGHKQDRAEICDDAVCNAGVCVAPQGAPCDKLAEGGRCDGDVLRYCELGHARSFDCKELGGKCRDFDGEPNCIADRPCSGVDRCRGDVAVVCVDGQRDSVDCAPGARCELDDAGHPRCVKRAVLAHLPCRGCACPPMTPAALARPVPIVAFIVSEGGHPVESEERVRQAVERASAAFADVGIELKLSEIRTIDRPSWLSANTKTVEEAERDPELRPRDKPFFVPLVFVRDLHVGAKAVPGLGSLPNGTCADLPRQGPVGDIGVVVLARLRYPTTLAHELGHYFGLCHTHQKELPAPTIVLDENGALPPCSVCGRTGDGVCDTPVDPGPDSGQCAVDPDACTVSCRSGEAPDPKNLMSYYVQCRRAFTAEQGAFLRRTAQQRLDSR
jgi:pregnancy-associated plasma protein-A